jgi:hypothetical protein
MVSNINKEFLPIIKKDIDRWIPRIDGIYILFIIPLSPSSGPQKRIKALAGMQVITFTFQLEAYIHAAVFPQALLVILEHTTTNFLET